MNNLKMAACGIDCNECDIYKAEHDFKAAESLVDWFRSKGWIGENENVEAVIKKAPFCKGCWNKNDIHWCGDCNLLICCEEKQLNHCGECDDFPCEKYEEWANNIEHHEKAMEYLIALKANS